MGWVAGVAAAVLGGGAAEAQSVARRVIVASGQLAPGTDDAAQFDWLLGLPTVNGRGDVAFQARLVGPAANLYTQGSIWIAPGGSSTLTLAYRGTGPGNFYDLVPSDGTPAAPFLNARGELAFWTRGNGKYTLLAGSPGQYRTVAATGDAPQGLAAGVQIVGAPQSLPMVSDAGDIYFEAALNNGPDAVGAFTSTAGSAAPQTILYTNGPATGLAGGTIRTVFSRSFTAGGRVALTAPYLLPSPQPGGIGVWTGTAGNLKLVAARGDAAPGVPGGHVFDGFESHTSVNASGAMVFTALTRLPPGTSGTRATYLYDGQALRRIDVPGTPVPGLGEGYTLLLGNAHRINDRGQVLMEGVAKGPAAGDTSFATWLRLEGGTLTPITRAGMAAPRLGTGVTFSSAAVLGFNGIGQSLVRAVLSGPGIDSTNNVSFWGVDPLGQYTLVARTGDALATPADGSPVITSLDAAPIVAGRFAGPMGTSLSDLGQVAYQARLADGTVANVLATLPAVIPGDANNDLLVDTADFQILYAHLYQPGDRTAGDFNGDGRVSFTDFQILERNFGRSLDGTATGGGLPSELAALVPEPGAVGLLVGGMLATSSRRRRRAR